MAKEAINIIGKEQDGHWSECYIEPDNIHNLVGQTQGVVVEPSEKLPHFRKRTYQPATIPLSIFNDLKREPETTIEDGNPSPKKEVVWSAKSDSPATVANITNAASRKHH